MFVVTALAAPRLTAKAVTTNQTQGKTCHEQETNDRCHHDTCPCAHFLCTKYSNVLQLWQDKGDIPSRASSIVWL